MITNVWNGMPDHKRSSNTNKLTRRSAVGDEIRSLFQWGLGMNHLALLQEGACGVSTILSFCLEL